VGRPGARPPAAAAAARSWRTCPITVGCEVVDRPTRSVATGGDSSGVADSAGDESRWVVTVPVSPGSDHGRLAHVSQTVRTAGDRSPCLDFHRTPTSQNVPGGPHGHKSVHCSQGSGCVMSCGGCRGSSWLQPGGAVQLLPSDTNSAGTAAADDGGGARQPPVGVADFGWSGWRGMSQSAYESVPASNRLYRYP